MSKETDSYQPRLPIKSSNIIIDREPSLKVPVTEGNLYFPLPSGALREFGSEMQKILLLNDPGMRPSVQSESVRSREHYQFVDLAHKHGYPATKDAVAEIGSKYMNVIANRREKISEGLYVSDVIDRDPVPVQLEFPEISENTSFEVTVFDQSYQTAAD